MLSGLSVFSSDYWLLQFLPRMKNEKYIFYTTDLAEILEGLCIDSVGHSTCCASVKSRTQILN